MAFQLTGKMVLLAYTLVLAGPFSTFAQPSRNHELYVESDRTQICANCNHQLPKARAYGWRGTPWRDAKTDGCRCGCKSGVTYYNAFHHWESPFSVLIDHGRYGDKWRKGTWTTTPRLRDKLDVLAKLRIAPPVRKDNGYCGPDCDPYGYVGVSRRGVPVGQSPQNGLSNNDNRNEQGQNVRRFDDQPEPSVRSADRPAVIHPELKPNIESQGNRNRPSKKRIVLPSEITRFAPSPTDHFLPQRMADSKPNTPTQKVRR